MRTPLDQAQQENVKRARVERRRSRGGDGGGGGKGGGGGGGGVGGGGVARQNWVDDVSAGLRNGSLIRPLPTFYCYTRLPIFPILVS